MFGALELRMSLLANRSCPRFRYFMLTRLRAHTMGVCARGVGWGARVTLYSGGYHRSLLKDRGTVIAMLTGPGLVA